MPFRVQIFSHCLAGMMVILALVPFVAVGQTQQPAVKQAPAKDSKTDAITGRVINESGQPLPNAAVWVRGVGIPGAPQVITTDREGTFKLTGLAKVPYSVEAYMPAHTPAPRDNPQQTRYRAGDSVTIVLIKGGVITGRVTTADSEPVVRIGVRAEMIRDSNGRRLTSGGQYRENSTDDRGIYRVYGLPSGTYIVVAGTPNDYSMTGINAFESYVPTYAHSATRETAAEVTVRAGEETNDVDIRYRGEPGRTISGTVTGPANEEFGFTVTLTATEETGESGAQTNDSIYQQPGSREFVFNGIADGDYYLTAQSFDAGGQSLSESKLIKVRGADVAGIELVTKPLGSISGRVVLEESKALECAGKGRPVLTETSVAAWHKEEPTKDRPRFVWSLGVPRNADAQGNVTVSNLAPGAYRFVVQSSAKHWYLQSISLAPPAGKTPPAKPVDAAKTWTTVKSGDRLSGLTVTLAQGAATLQGQIELGEGETLPEGLFVYLVPAERERADDVLRFYATAVPDGKIVLNSVAPGRYWILAQPAIDGITKLRLPEESETRLRLRRAAEAGKTEIEFKPCQDVVDFRLKL